MLKKIYGELILIKEELHAIRRGLETKKKTSMDDLEIFYRSLTERERNLLNWAISLEKDSDDWKAINRLRRILSDEKQKVENR